MIDAGAALANLTNTAEVETAKTPITTATYGLNGGIRILAPPRTFMSNANFTIVYHARGEKSLKAGMHKSDKFMKVVFHHL